MCTYFPHLISVDPCHSASQFPKPRIPTRASATNSRKYYNAPKIKLQQGNTTPPPHSNCILNKQLKFEFRDDGGWLANVHTA